MEDICHSLKLLLNLIFGTNFWIDSLHLWPDLLLSGFRRQEFPFGISFQTIWSNQWDLVIELNGFESSVRANLFKISFWFWFLTKFMFGVDACHVSGWQNMDSNAGTRPSMGTLAPTHQTPLLPNKTRFQPLMDLFCPLDFVFDSCTSLSEWPRMKLSLLYCPGCSGPVSPNWPCLMPTVH